jgi:glyoxylase-like metal-dependent hydrolase (beta-lactamase superfamily II)
MQLTHSCFAITGLGYMMPWCVNAGFVVGTNFTLIVDSGGNTLAAQTIRGYASAVRPENTLRAINTEPHFDHIGGNSYFRTQGIEIWGHAGLRRTPEEFQAEMDEFNAAITNPMRRAHGEEHAFFHGTELALPDHPIQSDMSFDLGGLSAEVLLTPGHTPANLSVWVPEEGVLLSGDCTIREYLPNLDAGNPADWRVWLESLDRIEQLKPEILVSGHGPVSRGREIAAVLQSMRSILQDSIALGSSPTQSCCG